MSRPELPKIQFVSKPMIPPFQDGSKCLVRDLSLHMQSAIPHVLGTREKTEVLGPHTVSHSVYGEGGGFSPGLRQNFQATLFLLLKSRADLWHFVFAPNTRSSQVGRMLRTMRRIPIVQTIASPPRDFSHPERLLFAHVAVAQSEWTRANFLKAYDDSNRSAPPIEVIPPPAPHVKQPSADDLSRVRKRIGVEEGQALFLYPGDLEISQGAAKIAEWSRELAARVEGVRIVIAYRSKTEGAKVRARELQKRVDPEVVKFECDVHDIHALVAASTAVLFPVDDLYGKVDQPIVLLEAMRLGTPVLALNEGPLASLQGAHLLGNEDSEWLGAAEEVAKRSELFEKLRSAGRQAVEGHYAPQNVVRAYEEIYAGLLSSRA